MARCWCLRRQRERSSTVCGAGGAAQISRMSRPADDRAALAGMVFVLETDIGWNQLPRDLLGV